MQNNFNKQTIQAALKQGVTTWREFILFIQGVSHV